jgi:hypothetical protein
MKKVEWKDELVSHTEIRLSFWDRLRVLLHGLVNVRCNTKTENIIGRTRGESTAWVRPIRLRPNRPIAMELKERTP